MSLTLTRDRIETVRRLALSPILWGAFGLLIAAPWLMPPLLFFFLWTFLFVPNGLIAWACALFSGIAPLALLAALIASGARAGMKARQCRAEKDAILQAYRAKSQKTFPRFLFAINLWLLMFVPSSVAISLWAEMEIPDGRLVHGKLHVRSPQVQLRTALAGLRSRGIFTPLQ